MAVSDLTKEAICNMAIHHCGSSAVITGLDDGSNEANICQLWYDQVRRKILAGADWPFAAQREILTATELTRYGWASVYKVPDEALVIRKMTPPAGAAAIGIAALSISSLRIARSDQRIPFKIENDPPVERGGTGLGKIVLCDFPNPECHFTADLEDVTLFPPSFVDAQALLLGAKIAPALSSDKGKAQELMNAYRGSILEALAEAFNESQDDPTPPSKYEAIREGGLLSDMTGYGDDL